MWHHFILGLFLGWGAAVPIGPINLEIIRRNLRLGIRYGISFGFGACTADVTYFVLLLSGALVFLQQAIFIRVIGIIGSGILIWFGISTINMPVNVDKENGLKPLQNSLGWNDYFHGYLLTLVNPLTILFWASLSTQLAILARDGLNVVIYAGIGVLLGTISWVIGINIILHFTRHRLSKKAMHYLNRAGGVILLCFAGIGLWHAIQT